MMKGVSAHGSGERRQARDVPTAAVRLAGSGFRTWLRSVVPDLMPLEEDGVYPRRVDDDRPGVAQSGTGPVTAIPEPAGRARFRQPDADLAALCDRLDGLSRQLGRTTPEAADEFADRAMRTHAPAAARDPSGERDPDLSGLERQLKFLTTQLEILRAPCCADEHLAELRGEVGRIMLALDGAISQSAFQELQNEVRGLAARLEQSRIIDPADDRFADLERGLAELRAAVHLAPIEIDRAVQILSQKIDHLSEIGPDPLIYRQLDNAIDALRGIVSQIVSGDALTTLGKDVRALGEKVEQAISAANPNPAALLGRAMQALERQIAELGEKLSTNGGASDPAAAPTADLAPLEQQIAQLAEKLNASEVRLDALHSIERGMTDLLGHFAKMQVSQNASCSENAITAPPAGAKNLDEERSADDGAANALQASADSASHEAIGPAAAMAALTPAAPDPYAEASRRNPNREELIPPLDAHREAQRAPHGRSKRTEAHRKPRHAPKAGLSDRIGSQAPRPTFILAARRAAKVANDPHYQPLGAALPVYDLTEPPPANASLAEPGRTLLVSTSLILVGLSAAGIAFLSADLLGSRPGWLADRATTTTVAELAAPAIEAPLSGTAGESAAPSLDLAGSLTGAPPRAPVSGDQGGSPIKLATIAPSGEPTPLNREEAQSLAHASVFAQGKEATGSIGSQRSHARVPLPASAPGAPSEVSHSWLDAVPPAIATRRLLAGIADRNPAAAYEMGQRYSQGRGAAADLAAAAIWFARAADDGLAPAQFRLGSMYEKGLGVEKDLKQAHRLYLAAAAKGHPIAMHNVAVIYAEGIDGKPDLTAAVDWFRRAAEHGIVDSQYNLAVLHARGQGVERNLAESFKWFATAAANGDRDAAARRDEIAAQLDPATLAAARLAAAAFSPKPPSRDATTAPEPPGGWDDRDPPADGAGGK